MPSATGRRTACKRTAVPLSFVSPRQDTDIPALTSREEWDRGQCKAGKCPLAAPGHTDPCPTARDTRQGVHKPRAGMSLAPRHLVQHPRARCVPVPVSPRPSGACASAHPRSLLRTCGHRHPPARCRPSSHAQPGTAGAEGWRPTEGSARPTRGRGPAASPRLLPAGSRDPRARRGAAAGSEGVFGGWGCFWGGEAAWQPPRSRGGLGRGERGAGGSCGTSPGLSSASPELWDVMDEE